MTIRKFKIENIGKQTDFKKGGVVKCIDEAGKGKVIVKLDGTGAYVTDNKAEFKLNFYEMVALAQTLKKLRNEISAANE